MADAFYYRYEDFLQGTGGIDMWGEWEPGPSVLRVRLVSFEVIRKTPKGAWVNGPDGRQFIADRWYKKFANPTKEGARADFIARKRRLIAVQERRIRDARLAIETVTRNTEEKSVFGSTMLKAVHDWEVERLK